MQSQPSGQGRGGTAHRAPELETEQVRRYSRHLLLPQVGVQGQGRIHDARVLVVGAGGLAAPVLQYLAAAGIGRLTVVDDDRVELSNLQRQVVHRTVDIGVPKVESAARAVAQLNPDVDVRPVAVAVEAANVVDLCSDHDIVVDATDNFDVRFLLNDACVLLGLPLVWAAVNQFDGQVTVWSPGQGPCLRCLFPVPPDPSAAPSCAEAGVLGVLPAMMGAAQAGEVLKLVLGVGRPLIGRLAVFDALAFDWTTLPIAADPTCPACAADASPITPALGAKSPAALQPGGIDGVDNSDLADVHEVHQLLREGAIRLIDVRTAAERAIAAIDGAQWLPLEQLSDGAEVDPDGPPIVLMCKSGARSVRAVQVLAQRGISARSMAGGITRWSEQIDPSVARY